MNSERLPEDELLFCIARKTVNNDLAARMTSLLSDELDWNYLCEKARQQRLMPLLYQHLSSVCPQSVPAPILTSLKDEFRDNSQRCLYLFSELRKVARLFAEQGVPSVVFKGQVLAAAVYGDIGLRQAGDIDILIEPASFGLAKNLLNSAGYKMEPVLTKSQESAHLRFHCEIQFVADAGRVVDLHWRLSPKSFPFALDPNQVMRRAKRVTIQSTSLLTFSPEDMVLYLCFHGSKHYWSRLEWIGSLAEFIRASETIEWSAVVDRSKASYSLRMLRVGLLLAQDFGELHIPDFVFGETDELKSLRETAEEFKSSLFVREFRAPDAFQMFRYNLRLMDRKRDAVLAFLRSTFVPTISDWQEITLPAPLYPLYYLFRIQRLMKKYWGRPSKERSKRNEILVSPR
jgi:Uncharacterised nucleotidyltransferase